MSKIYRGKDLKKVKSHTINYGFIKDKEDYKIISILTIVILFYSIILELVGDRFG